MSEKYACRCGEVHEPYEGYQTCPVFHDKVNILAEQKDTEPVAIISKGLYQEPVPDRLRGFEP